MGQELTIRTKHQGTIRRRYIPVKLLSHPIEEFSVPASLSDYNLSMYLNEEKDRVYRAFSPPVEFKGGRLISSLGSIGLARMSLDELENPALASVIVKGKLHYVKPILDYVKKSNVYCK